MSNQNIESIIHKGSFTVKLLLTGPASLSFGKCCLFGEGVIDWNRKLIIMRRGRVEKLSQITILKKNKIYGMISEEKYAYSNSTKVKGGK